MKSDLINCTCICPEVANWWNDVEKFGFKTEVRSESLWERLSNFCIRDPFGHVSEASTLTANEQDIIKGKVDLSDDSKEGKIEHLK